ncbi:MAG: HIP---CoA ligase [Streptosporangiaceae bacterium]|nr:HIP---CoA ligase [Streptosporangiaceae bacterium]
MELTVPAAVASAAREFGDATALAEPGGPRFSYRELHERVSAVARGLIAEGVAPGDRVAIWSPNTHHWVLAALGALHAGATLVPVNTRFTGPEALDVISRSGARALIVAHWFLGTDRLAALRAAEKHNTRTHNVLPGTGCLDQLRVVVRVPVEAAPMDDAADDTADDAAAGRAAGRVVHWDEFLARGARVPGTLADARAAMVQPEHVSDILFTSGTTGRSKGAMSAHRQSLAVARAWADCGGLNRADRYLVVNPFFHSFGFKAGILACLVSGATLVPLPVYDAEQAMRLVDAEQITVFPGAPTIYQTILDHPGRAARDLSSLRLAVTGAATVPVALVERMRRELSFDTVLTAYGLTEAVVATMCRPGDDPQTVARTSGRATAGFEIRLAGPDGPEAAAAHPGEQGPGEQGPGEILLRGPNVMLGYLDDPAATKAAVDADGWLHTGDIGRLDPRGYLTITDRLKDMYICGGFNVYPAEVEQVLARLDGVAESAVIGVPDDRLGEVGQAYVVTRPGRGLDEADVLAFCRERLANYKVPRRVEFRADLPRNPAGKPLKRLLREECG